MLCFAPKLVMSCISGGGSVSGAAGFPVTLSRSNRGLVLFRCCGTMMRSGISSSGSGSPASSAFALAIVLSCTASEKRFDAYYEAQTCPAGSFKI